MARPKQTLKPEPIRMPTASNPEAQELQLTSLAIDLVKQQLIDGTISSQNLNHFLKLTSVKEKLELEKLRKENLLLQAKTDAIKEAGDIKELYANAIKAMGVYSGDRMKDD